MAPSSPKAAHTRQKLVNASAKLFAIHGYEKTTLRSIAAESGMSLGSAYYYFESKEQLAGELYRATREAHRNLAWPRLLVGNTLEGNIRAVMDTALDALEPFQGFGPAFLRAAFSGGAGPEAADADVAAVNRAKEFGLWRQAVTTARPQPPLAIRNDLPELLWLVQRGILLFWAYDASPGRERTRRLVRNAAPLLARLSVLSRLPVVRAILDDVIGLVRSAADGDRTPYRR
ncbi:TetR family transcriptional regulator [Zafaria sp. Z1313]|uniref:TetR/AcrR family transcriptional regulator n=1 Tax=unclassified Zafaria TaxID=2828765 RepID=UPI002E78FA96|nr:TetR family transcriptional regulator [Zafaria sp. J156]MEE1621862.1 TetR family transcriptional regulator [Zafaria sp. J156]